MATDPPVWSLRQLAEICRYAGCQRQATVELLSGDDPRGRYCQSHGWDMLKMHRGRTTQTQPAVKPGGETGDS